MTKRLVAVVLSVVTMASAVAAADSVPLPPEVTPALRAACETDVRRMCVGDNPTFAKVKSCVLANYRSFGARCKAQIALAGLGL